MTLITNNQLKRIFFFVVAFKISFVYLYRCTYVTIYEVLFMNAILTLHNSQLSAFENQIFDEINITVNTLNDDEREIFEERAAIMEHEGGLSPEEAEWRALRIALNNSLRFAV